ncbi:ABC transporter permease [Flavitalea sp. BT771]|uniref:ABC transporter permease n=1 Tax=Flavitalea sp. BT771 TaxID=3063329 RepID=UPI0026E361E3|nr:ABC transporter permease [Flavitalea sp. BT771]MDO6429919.1 ABC transporter permease [Flavitalea sp. BT771]MDV6217953.1 ABC transporter permease [Flavitalea sp. BT771]
MRTLFFLLEKEFRQIMRNKGIVRLLIIAPVIQLILLPLAADYSVKNISIAVVDNDHSTASQRLIGKITSSGYFKLTGYTGSYTAALSMVEQEKADLALQIPAHFEKDLVRENSQKLYVAINAIEGTKANLGGAYLSSIITDFNDQLRVDWHTTGTATTSDAPQITVAASNWYNPYMDFHLYIVPAILVTLVTTLAAMQTAFNIVQEKESGTIEQINVTPLKKHIFIIGKLVPFLVLGIILFTLGLLVGWLFYGIVPVGSFWVLYISLVDYLFAMLGLGLLLATYSTTQMQAMSLSFFFINIFNMMSGAFTAVDSMPGWARAIVQTFPPSHFIRIMRMVVLKGSGLSDILYDLGAMALIGLVLNGWAILNYRKTA